MLSFSPHVRILTSAYSIFSKIYKGEELNTVNTFFKSTIGVGQILGLIFGTFLYLLGGFQFPFIAYGIVNILISPLVMLIPTDLGAYSPKRRSKDDLRIIGAPTSSEN